MSGHDHDGGRDPHHGHDHGHAHDHGALAAESGSERRLIVLLGLQITYMAVEIGGGLYAGSLALLADATHMASDAAALVIVLFAMRMARRPASARQTFGYQRAEVLAATVNSAALLAVAVSIVWEAWERVHDPEPVLGGALFAIAAGGLGVNLLGLWLLAHGREGNLNMRGAWLHLLSDALGSVGAMIAGAMIWAWGWRLADPIVSAVIAVLVLRSAWLLLQEAVGVLMESAPAHIDVGGVREAIRGVAGVIDVHDLHVWCIGSGQVAMSGHVVATFDGRYAALLLDVKALLQTRFGISHATIQVEPPGFEEQDLHP